jgi:hypothetical protein
MWSKYLFPSFMICLFLLLWIEWGKGPTNFRTHFSDCFPWTVFVLAPLHVTTTTVGPSLRILVDII